MRGLALVGSGAASWWGPIAFEWIKQALERRRRLPLPVDQPALSSA
ncbi:MAG TPA: hypothetical protein VE592_01140 [Geminicoccaceae bacterium]|nr:hypothetical protein [Geminicoccaceae bacterium]